VSPAPDLKLLLLGVAFPRQVQLTADDFQGQLAADHIKQSTSNGLVAVSGTGEATPAFLREMLTPLRTVKPDTDDNLAADVTDVRFYRVWCYGKNGLRVQASPGP